MSGKAGNGVVFAATGRVYRDLARRAARNVRQVMPGLPIDLFTDAPLEDPVFAAVHMLDGAGPRPKMEALRRSRFARTLYLDCDVVVIADMSDVFDCLDRADIAGAHEQFGSAPVAMQKVRNAIPPSFRQINAGVLAVRKSESTDRFLDRWAADFRALNLQYDQPLLRELLYHGDLRLAVLPAEYNTMHLAGVRSAHRLMMAPRALHLPVLHEDDRHSETPEEPFDPGVLLSAPVRDRINELMRTDRTLGARRSARVLAGDMLRRSPMLYRLARRLRRLFV